MFRQIRMNTWRAGTPRARIEEAIAALIEMKDQVDEIRGWFHAESTATDGGDDFDFVLVVDFDDEAAYQRYLNNPTHMRVVNELIRPILDRTVRIRCVLDGAEPPGAAVT